MKWKNVAFDLGLQQPANQSRSSVQIKLRKSGAAGLHKCLVAPAQPGAVELGTCGAVGSDWGMEAGGGAGAFVLGTAAGLCAVAGAPRVVAAIQ